MVRTVVLVSGGGTNLQSLIDANLFGELQNCELKAVVSSNPDAYAMTRAKSAGIPSYIVDSSIFPNRESFFEAVTKKLRDLDAELVVFAGFTPSPTKLFLKEFSGRIINVYPVLLPFFSGEAVPGHEAAQHILHSGMKIAGATACFVTDDLSNSPIILQKAIDILEGENAVSLQRRITEECEWKLLPRAVSLFCTGSLTIEGNTVHIKNI